jgi:hypothetical protein
MSNPRNPESGSSICCIQGSNSIKKQKEKTMNRYNVTTPRAAAGAAALAASALIIGLSVIAPAKMDSASADLRARSAAVIPVALAPIEIRADRNAALVSVKANDVPAKADQQI